MITLDLTKGIAETPQYKAFKFPGGEIHLKLKDLDRGLGEDFIIHTRLNTSDDIMLLAIAVDTLKKNWNNCKIAVYIPYFPYQQADRDFGRDECFSLKTVANLLNSLPVNKFLVFDPHSDVTPALLRNCEVMDNAEFICDAMANMYGSRSRGTMYGSYANDIENKLIWLSPDAGAYKKIFKLAEKIGFRGDILCCQKNRDIKTGEVSVVVPNLDAPGGEPQKDILIIDDICVGGRTFIEIAKKIKKTGGRKLYLAVSHGIFSNSFEELMKHFDKVFTTNSRQDSYGYFPNGRGAISFSTPVPETFLQTFKII